MAARGAEERIRNHPVVVPGLGRVIEVSTFSQWLATQEDREDEAGWFAQYWKSVTPGRVSSVTGVIRHLDQRLADALAGAVAEEDLADLRRALSAVRDAAAGYGQDQLADQAQRAGLRVIRPARAAEPDLGEPSPALQAAARAARTAAEPVSAPVEAGDTPEAAESLPGPARRLDRIEADLAVASNHAMRTDAAVQALAEQMARMTERQDKIIELLSALVFPENAHGSVEAIRRAYGYEARHAAGEVTRPDDPRRAPAAARYLKPDGGWDFEALFTATGLRSTLPE
jgi:hypothetical protein